MPIANFGNGVTLKTALELVEKDMILKVYERFKTIFYLLEALCLFILLTIGFI